MAFAAIRSHTSVLKSGQRAVCVWYKMSGEKWEVVWVPSLHESVQDTLRVEWRHLASSPSLEHPVSVSSAAVKLLPGPLLLSLTATNSLSRHVDTFIHDGVTEHLSYRRTLRAAELENKLKMEEEL